MVLQMEQVMHARSFIRLPGYGDSVCKHEHIRDAIPFKFMKLELRGIYLQWVHTIARPLV